MTYTNTSDIVGNTLTEDIGSGVSEAAHFLASYLNNLSNDYQYTVSCAPRQKIIVEELSTIFVECSKEDWDGYDAKPVNLDAMNQALRFLQSLPLSVPLPEVSADPDGEVTFEWNADPRRILYMSIGLNGVINYAGLYGSSKSKGIEYFSDEVPDQVLRCIKRVYR